MNILSHESHYAVKICPFPSGPICHRGTDDGSILGFHSSMHSPFLESAFHHSISSSVPNNLPSLMSVGSIGSHPGLTESAYLKFDDRMAENVHPHSLPDYPDALMNGIHLQSSNTMVSSISSQSMDRVDETQLCRVGSNGRSLEVNGGGKFDKFCECYILQK